jgi:hypothetical protein
MVTLLLLVVTFCLRPGETCVAAPDQLGQWVSGAFTSGHNLLRLCIVFSCVSHGCMPCPEVSSQTCCKALLVIQVLSNQSLSYRHPACQRSCIVVTPAWTNLSDCIRADRFGSYCRENVHYFFLGREGCSAVF